MATLYVVGTPIGNLEDVTLRALRVLKEADAILCEDTRVTATLLARYDIKKPLISYHEHSKLAKIERVIELLAEGKNLALVSDAGTPGVSDPGSFLVQKVREYSEKVQPFSGSKVEPLKIVSVPGPSALAAALSVAGVPVHDFVFLGFLPHKKGRETLFKEIAASKRAVIFYESPHRILKTLASLQKSLKGLASPVAGEAKPFGNKKIVIARELTKIHEETISGTPAELLEMLKKHPEKVRGEFVVVVTP